MRLHVSAGANELTTAAGLGSQLAALSEGKEHAARRRPSFPNGTIPTLTC